MAGNTPDIEIITPDEADDREAKVRARFWPTVRKAMRSIPFMTEVVAAYYAMLDAETPMKARLTLIGALAYFVTPFDFVPDIIFGIGFLDDATVLAAALAAVRNSITDDHRAAAKRALADGPEAQER